MSNDQSEQTGLLGGWTLKRQEQKQSVSDRGGEYSADVFLSTKGCKLPLLVTKNKIMNLKISI